MTINIKKAATPDRVTSKVCEVCGKSRAEIYLNVTGLSQDSGSKYTLVKCSECGLISLHPRPSSAEIAAYYSDNDPERVPRKPAFYEKLYFSFFRNIPLKKKGTLLDIGCGSGRYIYVMRDLGWQVKGIDITPTEYGKKELGLDIHEGDLLKANFPDESFDAVTLWWALEHIDEPMPFLKEAYRILKKGGVLLVGVPNIDSREAHLFKKYWFHLFLPRHVQHFTPVTLTTALKAAGFGRVKIRSDIFSFGIIGSLQNYLNDKGIKISLKNPFFYILSLPLDMVLGIGNKGGLMTAYAFKE